MFFDKLNKKEKGFYSIEEKIEIVNGEYEGILRHDNVNLDSLMIIDSEQEPIADYMLSSPSEKPWETHIKIFHDKDGVAKIYYETPGDIVDADDINRIQDCLIEMLNDHEIEDHIKEIEKSMKNIQKEINSINTNSEIIKQEINDIQTRLNQLDKHIGDLEELTTEDKTNIINAINELVHVKVTQEDIDKALNDYNLAIGQVISELQNKVIAMDVDKAEKSDLKKLDKELNEKIGDLNDLTTKEKESVVKAINELMSNKTTHQDILDEIDEYNIAVGIVTGDLTSKILALDVDKADKTYVDTKLDKKANTVELTQYLKKDGSDKDVTLGKGQMFETNFQNDNWSFINNYTGGGWARGLLNIKNKDGANYFQIGGNGSGQNFTRLYMGKAWNDWNVSINPNNNIVDVKNRLRVNDKDVATKEDIPTKVGELQNDKGYITQNEVDLSEIKGSIANLEKTKAEKEHSHKQYLEKSGGSMTGTLNVKTPNFPVARFERTTSATGNRYGAINLVRSGAKPVNGIGIGFYFKNNNSNNSETHSGFFGGALDKVQAGNEHGQLVFAPAYKGQDPYARTDFTLTALNSDESIANFKGQLKLNEKDVAVKDDVVTSVNGQKGDVVVEGAAAPFTWGDLEGVDR